MPDLVTHPNPLILIPFGVAVGVFAGLFGLGGGAVIVPLLVLVFGMSQTDAQGTSLAMILAPTAAPAIYNYWKGDHVRIAFALMVAPGMLVGSYFGAYIARSLPELILRLGFGFVLVYIAAYMIFSTVGTSPGNLPRTLILSFVAVGLTVGLYLFARWSERGPQPPVSRAVLTEGEEVDRPEFD